MSVKIGIVCEGISDYRVLKHVTERYLKDLDVFTIPLKPKETKQGKQDGFGSWQGVLEYIEGEDRMILEAQREGCEYVIVHIDTDVREQYGITGDYESDLSLHANVVDMLSQRVHEDFDKSRLIFAIAIHETECWLISFLTASSEECGKTNSCVSAVNRYIKPKSFYIDKDNKNADGARIAYDYILKQKRKPKDIKSASVHNAGFRLFIDSLDQIKTSISSHPYQQP